MSRSTKADFRSQSTPILRDALSRALLRMRREWLHPIALGLDASGNFMSSILTNSAALTAMTNLASTQKELSKYQSEASTGLKIENASDNAAYWSIAETMTSQLGALQSVSGALTQSTAIANVTYTALSNIITAANAIKTDIVAALQPGNDLNSIQNDIAARQNEIISIANAASFNGQNWLVDNWTVDNTETITHSFSDTAANVAAKEYWAGAYTESSDEVDTDQASDDWGNVISGVNDTTSSETDTFSTGHNILHQPVYNENRSYGPTNVSGSGNNTIISNTIANVPADYSSAAGTSFFGISKSMLKLFDNYTGSNTQTTNVGYTDQSSSSQVITDTETSSYISTAGLSYDQSLPDNGLGLLTQSFNTTVANQPSVTLPQTENLLTLDVRSLSNTDLQSALVLANSVTDQIVSAASQLGASINALQTQQTMLSQSMTVLQPSIASLVDADMDTVSTRLSALQVQAELGIQSLSIANSNNAAILKLFE